MQDYFQKIASRSGFAIAESNTFPAQILPQPQTGFAARHTGFEDELPEQTIQPAGTEISIDKQGSFQFLQKNDGAATNNLTGTNKIIPPPAAVSENYFHHNPDKNITADNKPVQVLKPGLSIIEKISQRNLQTTIIEKQVKEHLQADAGNDKSLHPSSYKKQNTDAGIIKNEKAISAAILPVNKTGQYLQPVQKLQEQPGSYRTMLPVQKENTGTVPAKKAKHENKLVIGRITVEVIRQQQPPVKTKEPQRQNNAVKNSNTAFSHINKLSFGLGQL